MVILLLGLAAWLALSAFLIFVAVWLSYVAIKIVVKAIFFLFARRE